MTGLPGLPTLLAPTAGLAAVAAGLAWGAAWPRSNLFGAVAARRPSALRPLPAVALTVEWDPARRGAAGLIDRLLDDPPARVCVFASAAATRERPDTPGDLLAAGHTIGSRGRDPAGVGLTQGYAHWRRALDAADDAIADATGRRPLFFRPPRGVKSPAMLREAAVGGQLAVTWARRLPPLLPPRAAAAWAAAAGPGAVLDLGASAARAADGLPELVSRLAVRGLGVASLGRLLGVSG